jgi:hypothetical protein
VTQHHLRHDADAEHHQRERAQKFRDCLSRDASQHTSLLYRHYERKYVSQTVNVVAAVIMMVETHSATVVIGDGATAAGT